MTRVQASQNPRIEDIRNIERRFQAPIHNESENFIRQKILEAVETAVRALQRARATSPKEERKITTHDER